jgi:hypothetical protein
VVIGLDAPDEALRSMVVSNQAGARILATGDALEPVLLRH